jgi:hypothetical protein
MADALESERFVEASGGQVLLTREQKQPLQPMLAL